jgi:hypothetical protein
MCPRQFEGLGLERRPQLLDVARAKGRLQQPETDSQRFVLRLGRASLERAASRRGAVGSYSGRGGIEGKAF